MPFRKTLYGLRDRLLQRFASRREALLEAYKRVERFLCIDLETTADVRLGPRPYHGEDHIFAWQVSDMEGKVEKHRITPGRKDSRLQTYLDDPGVGLVAHNYKFEYTMLRVEGYGLRPDLVWHDTMLQAQLLDNLRPGYALDVLAWVMCGWGRDVDAEVHRLARVLGGFDKVPRGLFDTYQDADVQRGAILHLTQWPEIVKDEELLADYIDEIELVKVTQIMEERGLLLDKGQAAELVAWLEEEVESAEAELSRYAGGRTIAPTKPDDLAWLLHTKLKLPVLAFTGTGKISTRRDVLQKLAEEHPHPALTAIERHRAYFRGIGIVNGYEKLVDSEGVVHPNLKTNHAATGRESCEAPNLQNVAKEGSNKTEFTVPARRVWRAREGYVLAFWDQSGIELRLIIEASGSVKLVAIQKAADAGTGPSPHVLFCQYIYGEKFVSKAENKVLYDAGKNGHFAKWYGANLAKVATTVGLTIPEARRGLARYERDFPESATLASSGTRVVRETGYITTPFGRDLRVPEEKPYAWLNYYIQGTAAGIIKRGQVQAWQALREEYSHAVRPVMTIHDEIVFEVPVEIFDDLSERSKLGELVSVAMTQIEGIRVPLVVERKYTRTTWDKAEGF